MAEPWIVPNGAIIRGGCSFPDGFTAPTQSIGDAAVQTGANVSAAKLEQQIEKTPSVDSGITNATKFIHVAKGDGSLTSFHAGMKVSNTGADTVTVDLLKNGVSVLSAVVTLGVVTPYALFAATIATVPYVAGDVFEVVFTFNHTSGTLGSGPFARFVSREKAQ